MYLLLFVIGVVGFTAMTALGFLHGGGGHQGGHGHAHDLSHHGGGHAGHHGHADHAHHDAAGGESRWAGIWSILSPLNLFSLALGAGGAGLLLEHVIAASVLPWASLAGALLFNYGIVKPLMNKMLGFASDPCEGLEGAVAKGAIAATRFDQTGRGLVKLTVDGQTVQILGTLDQDELARGILVAQGDSLTVLDVDPKRNTCRVTREMAI